MADAAAPTKRPTRAHITAARDARAPYLVGWKKNLARYRAGMPGSDQLVETKIHVNKDYAKTEQKKGQLFYQRPEIQLDPLQPGLEAITPLFQARINAELGPQGLDAKRLVDLVLFDVTCPAGMGWTEIGYEVYTADREVPDPQWTPDPALEQLGGPQTPPLVTMRVPIFERYFWERISPARALIPADFTGSAFEDAPWLGYDFVIDLAMAKRRYQLPEDFTPKTLTSEDDDLLLKPAGGVTLRDTPKVRGSKLWYRAIHFDPDAHPQQYGEVVFLDGLDEPVIDRPSPYQVLGEDGRMRGLLGNPIHPLTVRDVADSPYVPSDCQVARQQVDELGKFRTQMVQQRDRSLPLRMADEARFGKGNTDKLNNAEFQEVFLVDGLDANQPPVVEIARAQYPRENYTAQDYIEKDIDELWALSANQQGMQTQTRRTATELQIMQGATDVRLDVERNRTLAWFTAGVQKLAALIQQFDTVTEFVAVVGDDGTKRLETWDQQKVLMGRWSYAIRPDSSLRIDASQEREQFLRAYQFLANEPTINRSVLVEQVARRFNLDPARLVAQPPPKSPEMPKASLAIKGEDFVGPQAPVMIALLQAMGIVIPPEALQATQALAALVAAEQQLQAQQQQQGQGAPPETEHGGAMPQAEPLGKHQAEITGGMPGMGVQ